MENESGDFEQAMDGQTACGTRDPKNETFGPSSSDVWTHDR